MENRRHARSLPVYALLAAASSDRLGIETDTVTEVWGGCTPL